MDLIIEGQFALLFKPHDAHGCKLFGNRPSVKNSSRRIGYHIFQGSEAIGPGKQNLTILHNPDRAPGMVRPVPFNKHTVNFLNHQAVCLCHCRKCQQERKDQKRLCKMVCHRDCGLIYSGWGGDGIPSFAFQDTDIQEALASMPSIPWCYVTNIAVQTEIYKDLGIKFNSGIMKIGRLVTSTSLGFLIGMTLLSCKEEKTPQLTSTEQTQEIVRADRTESALSIENYFPGPNLMKYVVSEDNGLALTVDQEKTFAKWREMNHPGIQEKLMQISQLETEIKSLSRAGVDAEEILQKEAESEELRSAIANTKFLCHNLIRETLNPEQWETLVTGYETNFPLLERSKMKEVMQHVNPVPNYMKIIESDSNVLDLSPEQEAKFEAWRAKYHPQMMEMANQIIDLER